MNPKNSAKLGQQLWSALSACPPLSDHSPQCERLWLVAWAGYLHSRVDLGDPWARAPKSWSPQTTPPLSSLRP